MSLGSKQLKTIRFPVPSCLKSNLEMYKLIINKVILSYSLTEDFCLKKGNINIVVSKSVGQHDLSRSRHMNT